MAQVGRAPLHVAAQTGNLESLIVLLDAGAGRAPRDRVSLYSPLCSWSFAHYMVLSARGSTASLHILLKGSLLPPGAQTDLHRHITRHLSF